MKDNSIITITHYALFEGEKSQGWNKMNPIIEIKKIDLETYRKTFIDSFGISEYERKEKRITFNFKYTEL